MLSDDKVNEEELWNQTLRDLVVQNRQVSQNLMKTLVAMADTVVSSIEWAKPDNSRSGSKSGQSTHWSLSDERFLLDFVQSNMASIGEEFSSRPQLWNELAGQFLASQGKEKTATACKEKWKGMKKTFDIVHKIASTPGLAYSPENGADVRMENLHVWEDIVKSTKGASKFKTKGWIHYDQMLSLMKPKEKETFRTTAVQRAPSCATTSCTSPPAAASVVGQPLDMAMTRPPSAPPDPLTSSASDRPASSICSLPPSASVLPPDPSLLPPSVPSSYVGSSSASSVNPSSSVSARLERAKRKADDEDDLSMVSVGGSARIAKSARSRKRRAEQECEDTDALRGVVDALRATFRASVEVMEWGQEALSRAVTVNATAQRQLMTTRGALAQAEKRNNACMMLLQLDRGFLSADEILTMVNLFGRSDDCIDMYLILATTPGSSDGLRRAWLKKELADAGHSTDAGT